MYKRQDLTLYYPKWIPGEHAPDGPVVDLAGLKFSAGGKTLKWRRDLLDGFTIHVDVPAGENEDVYKRQSFMKAESVKR